MPSSEKITVHRGRVERLRFTVRDPVTGKLVVITGESAHFEVRSTPGAGSALITKTAGAGIVVLDQALYTGQLEVTLTADNTDDLVAGETYYYDLAVTIGGAPNWFQIAGPSVLAVVEPNNPSL